MPNTLPSAEQRRFAEQLNADWHYYVLIRGSGERVPDCIAALKTAMGDNASVVWAANEQLVVIGSGEPLQRCWLLEVPNVFKLLSALDSAGFQRLAESLTALEIQLITPPPPLALKAVEKINRWLKKLPYLSTQLPASEVNIIDPQSQLYPDQQQFEALANNNPQTEPVAMVNWLKFKQWADYPDAEGEPVSGQQAYRRYAKVAVRTVTHLGGMLVAFGRYKMTLVSDSGDPAVGAWEDFAVMQYPSWTAFQKMPRLKRYNDSLLHRKAGLSHQQLLATQPLAKH